MGLFDTIIFPKPFACPACGAEWTSTQTKAFENLMQTYQVGDLVSGTRFSSGILDEEVYCSKCKKFRGPVHVVIKYRVIVGIVADQEAAEHLLVRFGGGDWHLLYLDLYERYCRVRNQLHVLKQRVATYDHYLREPPEIQAHVLAPRDEDQSQAPKETLRLIPYLSLREALRDPEGPLAHFLAELEEIHGRGILPMIF